MEPSKGLLLFVEKIRNDLHLSAPAPNDVDPVIGLSPNTGTHLLSVFADVKGAESKAISWIKKFGEWKHVLTYDN